MQYVAHSTKTESCPNSAYTFIETYVTTRDNPITGKKKGSNIIEGVVEAVLTGKGGFKSWHDELDGGWKTSPEAKAEFAEIFPAPKTIMAKETIISMSNYSVYFWEIQDTDI